MSTYLYLECQNHDPPISSYWQNGEVGQHLSDLKDVQGYLANRESMVKAHELDAEFSRYANTAAYFFAAHPNCEIKIVDEYGRYHDCTNGP